MSRTVVLACVCVFALPFAVLLRQAEAAEASAASMSELAFPGAIDPLDPPRDHLDDSISGANSLDPSNQAPVAFDGIVASPRFNPRPSIAVLRPKFTPPPPSTFLRLCWLQVFRD